MTDANIHPSIILIRDRLHDIFPDIEIPLEIIGWHIRQSKSIEVICASFTSEIIEFGHVLDPRQQSNPTDSAAAATTTTEILNDDTLQSLYDVFNSVPRDHIESVYVRLKTSENPNWYDEIVNELLSYNVLQLSTNKRSLDEFNTNEYQRLLAILPDIDPDHAFETYMNYVENSSDETDFNGFITNLIEHGYVKLTDKLQSLRNETLKENLRNPKFEIEEFLKTFPDPLVYFYDKTKNVSESYKTHAYIYLANAFARVPSGHIRNILENNNYRFAPSMQQLQEEFMTYHNKSKSTNGFSKRLNHRARAPIVLPDAPDEIFYKELCYKKHEDEITEYLKRKQQFHNDQIRIAKENGTLQTCDCCCDDQLLDDDMTTCENNHKFCQTCVRNYIENNFITNGQNIFTCLNPSCKYEYSTTLIGQLLSPTLFSRLLIKIQQEELRLANIPNFEQCKFCTFGTIIDDPNERVFRCLNPECLKETCRSCGEPNHIPLRCDEVEKGDELDMRKFIENRVSEAMIRICYKCKQRFYKIEGCNKMTCACGASMCYVCRQPIQGYEHFNNNETCGANTDVVKLHQEEMRLAYEEAKKAYIERHPDAKDLVLKWDPQQHLTTRPKRSSKSKRRRHE